MDQAAVQKQLLSHPAVRKAVQKAGEQALADQAVQEAIVKAATEKGPDVAAYAAAKTTEWAQDPEVQAKAKHCAGVAIGFVSDAACHAGGVFVGCIEQGPAGLRVFSFAGGVASFGLGVLTLINPLQLMHFVSYTVSLYQAVFSATTMIFEANPEWINEVGVLDRYQDSLMFNARFLATSGGRGLFYVFQGSLWITLCDGVGHWYMFVTGAYIVLMGALHIAMHFDYMPSELVAKAKMVTGYQPVPAAA